MGSYVGAPLSARWMPASCSVPVSPQGSLSLHKLSLPYRQHALLKVGKEQVGGRNGQVLLPLLPLLQLLCLLQQLRRSKRCTLLRLLHLLRLRPRSGGHVLQRRRRRRLHSRADGSSRVWLAGKEHWTASPAPTAASHLASLPCEP